MAYSIPNIDLLQYKSSFKEIQSHCGNHGFLMTINIKSASIKKIRVVLEASKIHMLNSNDYFELIVDTRCSKLITPHHTYLVYRYITKLDKTMAMYDIA